MADGLLMLDLFALAGGVPLPFAGLALRFGATREPAPLARLHRQTCPHKMAALSGAAIEPNVFQEPWMIEAAEPLAARDAISMFTAASDDGPLGHLPVRLPHMRLAQKIGTVWAHLHCFDTTPLIKAGAEERFFDDLFDWLDGHGVRVLRWPRLALDGEVAERLIAYLERTGRAFGIAESMARPTLDAAESDERQIISRNRQRSVRRCLRRLSEIGTVSFRALESPGACEAWAHEFMRLEASGWKGEGGAGTALACGEDERRFFLKAFCTAAEQGQLLAHCLELDGTPIAMTVNFRSEDAVWAYKTAYDARYAKYGPGALVEVEGTRAMLADPTIRWVDSCSDGENQLLKELWRGERRVGEMLIAVRPGSRGLLNCALAVAKAKKGGRQYAKLAYCRLRRLALDLSRTGSTPTSPARCD